MSEEAVDVLAGSLSKREAEPEDSDPAEDRVKVRTVGSFSEVSDQTAPCRGLVKQPRLGPITFSLWHILFLLRALG